MKILKKNPKKLFTSKSLSLLIGSSPSCISRSLTKLINQKEVIMLKEKRNRVFYKLKNETKRKKTTKKK
jgi:hypothetical protein